MGEANLTSCLAMGNGVKYSCMKVKPLKSALPWLALALALLALLLSAGPVVGCPCWDDDDSDLVTLTVDVATSADGGDVMVGGGLPSDYPVSRSGEIGDKISLEAVPAEGYYFLGWSGDLTGNENPTEVRLGGDVEVTAHFFPDEFVSADELLHIVMTEGTVALGEDGEPLGSLEVDVSEETLSPPDEADIMGFSYELGPDGASFDQPISLSCGYDPARIPDRVAEEELFMAYYDEDSGQWLELPSTVDTGNHVVTTFIDHLSTFAVIAPVPPPLPADFSAGSLVVYPPTVDIGETVNISALVTNSGELEGSYEVNLEINGALVESQELTMAGGSQRVSFTAAADEAGDYALDVNGLEGSFTVREAPLFPITLPAALGWILLGPVLAALVMAAVILPIIAIRRSLY